MSFGMALLAWLAIFAGLCTFGALCALAWIIVVRPLLWPPWEF